MDWADYINKRGTLNIGRRIEVGCGLVALVINRAHKGKATLSDFTPHEQEEIGDSIADVSKIFKAVPNLKARRHNPKDRKSKPKQKRN